MNGGPATHCLTVPPRYSRYTTQSVNGIVCMDFGICSTVCNPSTRQAISLPFVCPKGSPAATSTYFCVNSFGFDPVTKQYKVLNSWANYQNEKTEYRVFILGTNSWRLVHDGPPYSPQRESICVNGVIYFRSWVRTNNREAFMVAFDVHNESFRVIGLPEGAPTNADGSCLIHLRGRVCIVEFLLDFKNRASLWMLEDNSSNVWIKHYVAFSSYWKRLGRDLKYFVVGTIQADKILLAPRCLSKPFYLFYYHIQTSNLRRVQISGLPEYDSFDLSRNSVTVTNYEENILSMV